MCQHENTTDDHRIGQARDLRLVVGVVHKTALVGAGGALPLWMAVALDGEGFPAALGLYEGPPTVGEVMKLVGDEPVDAHELGPQWTAPGASSVIVDHAVLWQAHEMCGSLAARGITVYALAATGHDRDRVDHHFSAVMKTLAAALKREALGRDAKGTALVTPQAAASTAREWRAAREAAVAGGLAG